MLIELTELIREGAMFEAEQPVALNPLTVDNVRPEEMPGFAGKACRLRLNSEESPTFVEGDFDEVVGRLNAAEAAMLGTEAEIT